MAGPGWNGPSVIAVPASPARFPSLTAWQFDEELARRIEQPVHLVAGGDSPIFTHRLVDHLAGMLPDARTTVIPGHNHLLPLTCPALLADLFRYPALTA